MLPEPRFAALEQLSLVQRRERPVLLSFEQTGPLAQEPDHVAPRGQTGRRAHTRAEEEGQVADTDE